MYKCLFGLLLFVYSILAGRCYGQALDVRTILAKFSENQEKTKAYVLKDLAVQKMKSARTGNVVTHYIQSDFRTDGQRMDYRCQHIRSDEHPGANPIEDPNHWKTANRRSFIWDNKRYIEFECFYNSENNQAVIYPQDPPVQRGYAVNYIGSPTRGVFMGDLERFDRIFVEAQSVQLLDKTEKIGTSDCYVIIGDTPYGQYKVWLDPEHGYNIAQAAAVKKTGDVFMETLLGRSQGRTDVRGARITPLGSAEKTKTVFKLEHVVFDKIYGHWFPIKATYDYSILYRDGSVAKVLTDYHVTEIELNPDFDKLQAFVPNHIPNGTPTYFVRNATSYVWQDGELIPYTNKTAED